MKKSQCLLAVCMISYCFLAECSFLKEAWCGDIVHMRARGHQTVVGRDCSTAMMQLVSVPVAEGNCLESLTICGRLAASAKQAICYTKTSLMTTVARIIDRGKKSITTIAIKSSLFQQVCHLVLSESYPLPFKIPEISSFMTHGVVLYTMSSIYPSSIYSIALWSFHGYQFSRLQLPDHTLLFWDFFSCS